MTPLRCAECGEPIWGAPTARVSGEQVYDVCTHLCAIVLRERLEVGDLHAEETRRAFKKIQ